MPSSIRWFKWAIMDIVSTNFVVILLKVLDKEEKQFEQVNFATFQIIEIYFACNLWYNLFNVKMWIALRKKRPFKSDSGNSKHEFRVG